MLRLAFRHRARDERARPHAHERGGAAVGRHARSARRSTCRPTIRSRSSRTSTSTRGRRGSRASPRIGPNAVLGAVLSVADATAGGGAGGPRPDRSRSPHAPAGRGRAAAREPALARPARAPQRQSVLDVRGASPARRLRRLHRPRRERPPRVRSRCGSTAPSSRAASERSPRRCRWTCAPRIVAGSTRSCARSHAPTGDDGFDLAMPPDGTKVRVPSLVAGFAALVRYRCDELGAFDDDGAASPVMDALMAPEGAQGGTRRHAELDGGRGQPRHRRRLRDVPEGAR